MTTNIESNKLGTPGRVLVGVFCALMLGLGLWAGASYANAETPGVIGVGTKITLIGGFGSCNVSTVDEATGTFTTAGHCGQKDDRFADASGNYIGTVISSATHISGVGDGNADVAIVRMAAGTIVRNEAPVSGAVAAPQVGDTVYKWGHGLGNQVVRFGEIVSVRNKDFLIRKMGVMPFDSGSPIIDSNGKVVGTLSGSPDAVSAFISAARALNIPVPPGAPDGYAVATRTN